MSLLTAPFRRIVDHLPGAEGPIQDRTGRWFVVSDPGPIVELMPGGGTREHAHTGGLPAGLQVDADNHLWCIDATRGILRVDPAGVVTPIVVEHDGKPLRGCNDGALDDAGHLYFTVPDGSSAESPHGRVFCRLADGEVRVLADGFAFCNGIAVSADNRTLVVAETWTRRLIAFDLPEPGVVASRRVFAELPAPDACGADGIDFDAAGHLIATHYGAGELVAFDPDGGVVERVALPFGHVSNLHLGGADGRDLVVTEHATPGVWRARWAHAGIRLAVDA